MAYLQEISWAPLTAHLATHKPGLHPGQYPFEMPAQQESGRPACVLPSPQEAKPRAVPELATWE